MKAVTSGWGWGWGDSCSSTLHVCQLGRSWGHLPVYHQVPAPLPCPPTACPADRLTAAGRGQYPQGLGPFGCALCRPEHGRVMVGLS